MSVIRLLSEMGVIAMMVLIGYYIRKKELITDQFIAGASYIVVNVTTPCVSISSAISSGRRLGVNEFLYYLMWCVLLFAILIAASYLVPAILHIPGNERVFYKMLMVYGNTGFIGLPVCRALYGDACMVPLILFNVCFGMIIYTYGRALLRKARAVQEAADGMTTVAGENADLLHSLRNMLNVGTLSGMIAMIIYLTNPPVPTMIVETLEYVSDPTIFLSMVVLGSSVATAPLAGYMKESGRMAAFLVVRMIVMPIVLVLIMRQFITDTVLLGTLTILLALPGGNLPLIMCRDMGIEADELAKGIILSTVACVVTIPIVCMFM